MSMLQYEILYDNGRPLIAIGLGSLSSTVFSILPKSRTQQLSVEDVLDRGQSWFDQHQFIVCTSDVVLKQKVVSHLKDKNAQFFSLVGTQNNIPRDTKIGTGTFINCFNDMSSGPIEIGSHCIITCFNHFGHGTYINDYCHVSSYCFISQCKIGTGCVIGVKTNLVGGWDSISQPIALAPYTNVMMNSVITKSIEQAGTYYSNRKTSSETSLEKRIL
jgi:carbonic anhydrase/acetyltransferase-like protein (isoleucine patch superfamily)